MFRQTLKTRLALRDFWLDGRQTALAIFALSITVFVVGTTFRMQESLLQSVDQKLVDSNPPTHLFKTANFPVADATSIIAEILQVEGVVAAEPLAVRQLTRMQFGDEVWRPLMLFGRQDLPNGQMAKIQGNEGNGLPTLAAGNIYLERSAAGLSAVQSGDTIEVDAAIFQTPVKVEHFIYDPISLASQLSRATYGYAPIETVEKLSGEVGFNQIYLSLSAEDEQTIDKIETEITEILEQRGLEDIEFYNRFGVENGYFTMELENPLTEYIEPALLLFQSLGLLSLLISFFLINTTMSGLIAKKRGEIGRLKAIGFSNVSITQIYLIKAILLGGIAFLFASLVELLTIDLLLSRLAEDLNLNIERPFFSPKIFSLKLLIGFLLPILATLGPVWRAVRHPADESLRSNTARQSIFQPTELEKWVFLSPRLPTQWRYAWRNLLRRKRRTLLMILPMAATGVVFISLLNVSQSLGQEFERTTAYWKEDIRLIFSEPVGEVLVKRELEILDEIVHVEPRFVQLAKRLRANETWEDHGDQVELSVVGLPYDTPFVEPTLVEGRWLTAEDSFQIVINTDFLRSEPDLAVGEMLPLTFEDGTRLEFEIVGVVTGQLIGVRLRGLSEPVAYLNGGYFSEQFNSFRKANFYHISIAKGGTNNQSEFALQLEDHLKQYQVSPKRLDIFGEIRESVINNFQITIQLSILMAILFGLVGAFGMSSLIQISILERKRELGILKSMGMNGRRVSQTIWAETLTIGFLSWVLSLPFAWILSSFLSRQLGYLFINAPGVQVQNPLNYLAWLCITVVLTFLISVFSTKSISYQEADKLLIAQ